MAPPNARAVVRKGRAGIGRLVRKVAPGAGPSQGATEDLYGGAYFGEGRDPSGDRQGRSGYASYDRISSNADIAAFLLWRNFQVTTTLDVGCATGFLVEALRELGVEAEGSDISRYAVEHSVPGAHGHIEVGNLVDGLPYTDGQFELVSTLEILEHLRPEEVPVAVAELRRISSAFVYATIPSFGANASGPDGFFEGKVRPERVGYYKGLGSDFSGPVAYEDLAVDADGGPVEGHLSIASFGWWTERFAEAGFVRRVDVERRLYADIEPAGLARFWNLYVFALPDADPALLARRRPEATLCELGLSHPLMAALSP